ncbi:hypothetical protein F4801DRAFT_529711 [Xylaria longipes]|nr:hypothetical protein F4801DRAFT_529711 [Xylaria longipes]RYC63080.1 hypothetical protein CHU98_g3116 [Xylaria longipes]
MKSLSELIPQSKMRKVTKAARVTKRRKLGRRPISPAIGSLYDIMHDNAGVSLFLRPLYWTDLHTKLLNCRFVQLPPQTTPTPPSLSTPKSSSSSQRSPRIPQTVVSIGKNLDTLMAPHTPFNMRDTREKDEAMAALLSTFYPRCFSDPLRFADLDILFGPYLYRGAANCQLLWHHVDPDANTMSFDSATTRAASQPVSRAASYSMASMDLTANNPSILAYVSRSHIDYIRRNFFRIIKGPNGAPNEPVFRMQSRRSQALIPKNLDEDPYFLGVMVAIAQQLVYTSMRTATGFAPRDVKVRMLTVAEEDEAFIVYTATVPRALLSMFHEPDTAPAGNSEVIVEHAHVPIWPVLGLKERLGKALGSDIVGEYDDSVMDTYEEELAPVAEAGSKKRGREALSEVFNGSFCDDCQHQSNSSSPSARRKRHIKEKEGRPCPVTV